MNANKHKNIILFTVACFISIYFVGCTDDFPPTCIITSPLDQSSVERGLKITINVDAIGMDGGITEIKCYIDDIGLDVASVQPYTFELETKNIELGIHKILVKAKDENGNFSEDEVSFELIEHLPDIKTLKATNIFQNNAVLNASSGEMNLSTEIKCGFYWSENNMLPDSTDNTVFVSDSVGAYSLILSDLKPSTTYYYRFFALNSINDKLGEVLSFTTLTSKVDDIIYSSFYDPRDDGKFYKAVQIGGQIWMAENLTYLPIVNEYRLFSGNPDYYVYRYYGKSLEEAKSSFYYKTYGALYNWQTAQEVCPAGWHLPTMADWVEFDEFVNKEYIIYAEKDSTINKLEYGKDLMAEAGWRNDRNGTDKYGFSALPGGSLDSEAQGFSGGGGSVSWWCISSNIDKPWVGISISNYNFRINILQLNHHFGTARSVRCIKD